MKQGQTILETMMMCSTNAKYCSERLINEARGPTSSFIAKVEPEMHEIRESAGKALALGDILQ